MSQGVGLASCLPKTAWPSDLSKPVALTDEEVDSMGIIEKPVNIDLEVGETVKVISGPLENFVAVIQEINLEKRKVKALVNMFGRETPVEIDFNQMEKFD